MISFHSYSYALQYKKLIFILIAWEISYVIRYKVFHLVKKSIYHDFRFSFHFSLSRDAKDLFYPVMITKKLWPHDLIWDVVKMFRKSCITNQCATKKKLHSSLIRICFIFIISFYGDGSRIKAYLAEILRLSKN